MLHEFASTHPKLTTLLWTSVVFPSVALPTHVLTSASELVGFVIDKYIRSKDYGKKKGTENTMFLYDIFGANCNL